MDRKAVQDEIKRLGTIHHKVRMDEAGNKMAGRRDALGRFVVVAKVGPDASWDDLLTAARGPLCAKAVRS